MQIEIRQDQDGALTLQCGESMDSSLCLMETDLVFAIGAMHGDPSLEKQRAILNYIKTAVDYYSDISIGQTDLQQLQGISDWLSKDNELPSSGDALCVQDAVDEIKLLRKQVNADE